MRQAAAAGPLAETIAATIRREGPITLERYWDLALFHPEHGYYRSRDPFGCGGDFVTAPEVSQMFGELLGAWLITAWRELGGPSPFVLAEMGPGRGTLMADILRTAVRLDPRFLKAARVTLVETSPRLARVQAERLAPFDLPIRHVRRLEDVAAAPLLLVANELFDAVAIRQFVAAPEGWREKHVALAPDGRLAFALAPAHPGPVPGLSAHLPVPTLGDTIEVSPQRDALSRAIAARLEAEGGAALIVDYGHARSAYGDTLQAVKDHAFADPLRTPGACDITSHVDFEAVAARFAESGLAVAPVMEQGEFLMRLGLAERAAQLGRADAQRAAIAVAARRLAGRAAGEMGALFKVLAVASLSLDLPPFRGSGARLTSLCASTTIPRDDR